jgi:hypothetical protein
MSKDQIDNMHNSTGNIAVYVKQLHNIAYQQWDLESESGSRSLSRDRLLCEIGTYCINIEYAIKQIVNNLEMLKEIPKDYIIRDNFELWIMR